MDFQNRINQLKEQTLNNIQIAATKAETDTVITFTKLLEEIKELEKNIYISLESLERKISHPDQKDIGLVPTEAYQTNGKTVSAKEKGRIRRNNFINMLEELGISLSKVKGVKYRTQNGSLIGIASASEDIKRNNYWFLGLPKDEYDTIVLLCESSKSEVYNFILPKAFYKQNENNFSRDSNNEQVKFNISLRDGKFLMTIPYMEPVIINEYIDNFAALRSL
jgi:hypothetical protein